MASAGKEARDSRAFRDPRRACILGYQPQHMSHDSVVDTKSVRISATLVKRVHQPVT
jgi:hypothetical protein